MILGQDYELYDSKYTEETSMLKWKLKDRYLKLENKKQNIIENKISIEDLVGITIFQVYLTQEEMKEFYDKLSWFYISNEPFTMKLFHEQGFIREAGITLYYVSEDEITIEFSDNTKRINIYLLEDYFVDFLEKIFFISLRDNYEKWLLCMDLY